MTEHRIFDIEGHILATLLLNPGTAGEPVILVHGITGSIAIWQVNPLPFVLEQGPCYSLSLPGHYPAAFPLGFRQEQLTAEMMARIMAEAIRRIVGKHPVTLMGHSTGGFAVLNLAAHYPGIARRIVSVAGFARGRWTGFLGFGQRLVRMGSTGKALFQAIYRLAMASPGLFRAALRAHTGGVRAMNANPDMNEVIELNLFNFRNLDLETMAQYFAVMPDIDITPLLPHIHKPALVIAGERDPTVPPEESRRIAAGLPNAELVLVPGARHLSFAESPVEYQATLSAWLQKTR
jgi:pimeloyl-ACP methyl ester carboxylesterase